VRIGQICIFVAAIDSCGAKQRLLVAEAKDEAKEEILRVLIFN